ncbi:DUF4332 domain-containing protein [Pleurocapsales cyanobacterium LEGE 10410]|nr:DUF4332 domain-containing protein [Pleurocapsales cyanobacterium LEGE 10410]
MQPQYWSIDLLPGLKLPEQRLLKANGINDTKELLSRAHDLQSKQALANKLKLNSKSVSKWVALADLARVPSVGCQYCGILLHTGIISVSQLAQTPFDRLHHHVLRLQAATLQRKLSPPVEQVKKWVDEAKLLQKS